MTADVRRHYDALIDENHDPFRDPPLLAAYMDKWDGQTFLDLVAPNSRESVLEIGVGTGRLAARVAPRCRTLCGIDLSPKTVCRAKENLAALPNVKIVCGDFLTYSFAETFDVIYSSLTFMHIREKRQAFERAATLLKPDGRFVLSIDKKPETRLVYGTRVLTLYPDTPQETEENASAAGFSLAEKMSVEFACLYVFTAKKDL